MTWLHALLLGVLEGLTEFLPVSSTGHLFLLGLLLGHDDDATKALDIVMQLGAVIAVVVYYRARLWSLLRGTLARDPASLRLLLALFIAFLPAAMVGLAFHKRIKATLMSAGPIGGALIVGGVVMIAVEASRRRRDVKGLDGLEHVTPKRALIIGLSQCFSLWPGASRSMSTIVGGQLGGLSTATAAEFSFLLSIPTLGAATVFDLVKHGHEIVDAPGGAVALAVSMATSFVVAFVVIAAFLTYLKRRGLAPFGWYRIAVGALVIGLVLRGGAAPGGPAALEPSARPHATAAP
jgi:undecaprenyl-diphosphatase